MWTIHTPLTLLDIVLAGVIGLVIFTLTISLIAYVKKTQALQQALQGKALHNQKLQSYADALDELVKLDAALLHEIMDDAVELDQICKQHLLELSTHKAALNVALHYLKASELQMGSESEGTH